MLRILLALTLTLPAVVPATAHAQDDAAAATKPRLGVSLGVSRGSVMIVTVQDGSAAARHGLRPGDVLLAVNQVGVTTSDAAVRQIQASGPAVLLRVQRGEAVFDVAVALGASPPASSGGSLFDAAPASGGGSLFDAAPASGGGSLFDPAPAAPAGKKATSSPPPPVAPPAPEPPPAAAPPPPAPVAGSSGGDSLFAPVASSTSDSSLFAPAGPDPASAPASSGTASVAAYTGGLLQQGSVPVNYSCASGLSGTAKAVAGQCQPQRNEFSRAVACGDRDAVQSTCEALYACLGQPVANYCRYR